MRILRVSLHLLLCASTAAGADRFSIVRWDSEISLEAGGATEIVERLNVDFGRQKKHGIRRWIPTSYRDPSGFHYDMRLKMGDVTDGTGAGYPVKFGRDGRNLTLRIGDPDRFASRRAVYEIDYRVDRAWIHDETFSVFRWNVTGNAWEIPIDKVELILDLPDGLASDAPNLKLYCFTGRFGSTESDCRWRALENGQLWLEAGPFAVGEGLSIELEIPPGVVQAASWGQRAGWLLADNWMLGIPIAVLALMLLLWNRNGRDRTGKLLSVMPEYYPPEDLRPAEAGTLIDEKVDMRDISSTIIDFAVRGFITIEEIEKEGVFSDSSELRFQKTELSKSKLKNPFERKIYSALFCNHSNRIRQSELENQFYSHLSGIKNELYSSLTSNGYFLSRPDRVRALYWTLGLGALGGGVWLAVSSGYLFRIPWGVSLGLSGLIVAVIGTFMPARTRKGSDANMRVRGFLEFANRVDKDRYERLGAELFDRYLPYAVALGVEKSWAKRFDGLDMEPPSWYRGNYGSRYSPYWLVHSWDRHSTGLHRSMASTPRGQGGSGGGISGGFGGGGFSGGGFGGGGGGGW